MPEPHKVMTEKKCAKASVKLLRPARAEDEDFGIVWPERHSKVGFNRVRSNNYGIRINSSHVFIDLFVFIV